MKREKYLPFPMKQQLLIDSIYIWYVTPEVEKLIVYKQIEIELHYQSIKEKGGNNNEHTTSKQLEIVI